MFFVITVQRPSTLCVQWGSGPWILSACGRAWRRLQGTQALFGLWLDRHGLAFIARAIVWPEAPGCCCSWIGVRGQGGIRSHRSFPASLPPSDCLLTRSHLNKQTHVFFPLVVYRYSRVCIFLWCSKDELNNTGILKRIKKKTQL